MKRRPETDRTALLERRLTQMESILQSQVTPSTSQMESSATSSAMSDGRPTATAMPPETAQYISDLGTLSESSSASSQLKQRHASVTRAEPSLSSLDRDQNLWVSSHAQPAVLQRDTEEIAISPQQVE
jgi:hypothetical protein